ncbi:hypothetical protein SK128_024355 [Halocaridina rubra]|uniref:Uncharacterized protein n=1 Tax=Halocaridina rubra TaxID=373956 RepID=A0AAN8WFV1_HALRR
MSFSSSSPRSLRPKSVNGIEGENDDRVRGCSVKLIREPLVGPLAYHWLLSFDWGDYQAHAEATEVDGYLTPYWVKSAPDIIEGSITHDLGCIYRSPKEVWQKVKNNKFNYFKYMVSGMNCQRWAREVATQLGPIHFDS